MVHAVPRTHVDAQLPYSVPAKPVIAEITQLRTVDAPIDSNPSLGVTQATLPLDVNVFAVRSEVMANLEYK
jgi:hypothetical protein